MEVTYKIFHNGTQRGGPLLVDSHGFSYTRVRVSKKVTTWTCSVRTKSTTCNVKVKQRGEAFQQGPQIHNHPPEPGLDEKIKIVLKTKAIAKEDCTRSATAVARDALCQSQMTGHTVTPPALANLVKTAFRARKKRRLCEPENVEFEPRHIELETKAIAKEDCTRSATAVARDALCQSQMTGHTVTPPALANLVKTAFRARKKRRLCEPGNVEFEPRHIELEVRSFQDSPSECVVFHTRILQHCSSIKSAQHTLFNNNLYNGMQNHQTDLAKVSAVRTNYIWKEWGLWNEEN